MLIMDNKLHPNHPVIRRVYVYIFVITFLLLFLAVVVYFSTTNQLQNQRASQTPQPLQPAKKYEGSLSLAVKSPANGALTVGTPFVLQVLANSNSKDVVGYDLLLSYDQTAFKLGTEISPLASFKVYPFQRGDHETYTAIKAPEVKTPTLLNQDELLTISMTPLKQGSYTLKLLDRSGKETTKMVDVKTHILTPQLTPLQVTVSP